MAHFSTYVSGAEFVEKALEAMDDMAMFFEELKANAPKNFGTKLAEELNSAGDIIVVAEFLEKLAADLRGAAAKL